MGELISRIMKNALRKGSATSDDDSMVRHGRDDDDTDTEHHDSLPLDEEGKEMRLSLSKVQPIRRTRKPSLVDIVQLAKSERERERAAATVPVSANGSGTKPRGRTEKEKEVKGSTSPVPLNDNDPETNSRIVNERRQSLLLHKREEDAEQIEPKSGHQKETPKGLPVERAVGSNFEVIDEKTNKFEKDGRGSEIEDKKQKPVGITAGANKNKTKKNKTTKATTGRERKEGTKAASSDTTMDEASGTTPTTTMDNSDKISTLSRLGRKKIGTLLALVRDAVNVTKSEGEPRVPQQQQGTDNKTSAATKEICGPVAEKEQTATAIEMPSTPIEHQPLPDFSTGNSDLSAPAAEEIDEPGPIQYGINRGASQRRKAMARTTPIRQDSQVSVWSDNIPTITISMGSDECIIEPETRKSEEQPATVHTSNHPQLPKPPPTATASGPVVNIIKINMEDE